MDSKHGEVRTGTQADLQIHRLPLTSMTSERARPDPRGTLPDPKLKNSRASDRPLLFGQETYVTHRPVNSYIETRPPRSAPHKADPVHQKIIGDLRITRKVDPNPKTSLSTLKMVAPRGKCPSRSANIPTQPCSSDL